MFLTGVPAESIQPLREESSSLLGGGVGTLLARPEKGLKAT